MTKCSCYLEKCQPTTVSQVNCHELPKYYLNYGFFWGAKQHLEFQVVRGRHAIHLELWAQSLESPQIFTPQCPCHVYHMFVSYFFVILLTLVSACIYIYSIIFIYIYIISYIHTGSGIPSSASLHGHPSQPNNMAHDFFGPSQKSHLEQ